MKNQNEKKSSGEKTNETATKSKTTGAVDKENTKQKAHDSKSTEKVSAKKDTKKHS